MGQGRPTSRGVVGVEPQCEPASIVSVVVVFKQSHQPGQQPVSWHNAATWGH
jgi:hypothetical protein